MGGLQELTNALSKFRTVPSPTHYGLPFPKIGVGNPTQNSNHYYLRKKFQTSNSADTFTGSIQTKPHSEFTRKGSVGISRDCPMFLSTPYYLRNG